MAIITRMPSRNIVNALRGVLDFYTWCDLVIVRKWPRAPERSRNPAVMATAARFMDVNKLAPDLTETVTDAYKEIASQTGLTWKDWMTRLAIAGTSHVNLVPPPEELEEPE